MRLRRRRLVAKAACSFRRQNLSGNSIKPCDAEVGNDFERKDTFPCDDIVGHNTSIDQKSPPATPLTPTGTESSIYFPSSTSPETLRQTETHHLSRLLYSHLRHFLSELLKPTPIVIVFAIVIALVDPLKALFLPPSPSFQPRFRPIAPDGQPPLAFILDTATFVGAACVPIGLICLGSALACLRVRSGNAFPLGAITALALSRMVVTPVLGIMITRLFTHAGFVHRDDKVLQFVCMCVCP